MTLSTLRNLRRVHVPKLNLGKRPSGYKGRHRGKPEEHKGATKDWSPIQSVDAVGPGMLRDDDHEDLADLEVEAAKICADRAARNPEADITSEFAVLDAAIAAFSASMDGVIRAHVDERTYSRLIAAEHLYEDTQAMPIIRRPKPGNPRSRFAGQRELPAGIAA